MPDESEQKRTEEETAERGAMLQQIMDTASVAIFLVDKTGHITHANRRMAEMFGRTLEEVVGCEYVELVHPSEKETGRKNMLALLASEIPSVDLERLYWRKDCAQFWGHLAGRRFHDVHGNDLGLIGVIADIDKRKKSEEMIHQLVQEQQVILQTAPIGISFIKDRKIIWTNPSLNRIFGYKSQELWGKSTRVFYESQDDFLNVGKAAYDHIGRGDVYLTETKMVYKNGDPFWVNLIGNAVNPDNPADGSIWMMQDISERKKAEIELKEALSKVKLLSGMLPICSSCKKIRDDQGYWNLLEAYVSDHSEAEFSHSICPECAKRLYPEFYDKIDPNGKGGNSK
jgi:PAS domain S-box-containing protein